MKKAKKNVSVNTKTKTIIVAGILSIILAVGSFFFLTMVEKVILNGATQSYVYVTKDEIKSGTILKESDFEKIVVSDQIVPTNAISDSKQAEGCYAEIDLGKGEILTTPKLKKVEDVIDGDKMVGISCDNLSTAVNGIIRTSDYIDIYVFSDDGTVNADGSGIAESSKPAFANIYVLSAFDENGKIITNADDTSIAKNFNVVINEADADKLVNALSNNKIYITKSTKEIK